MGQGCELGDFCCLFMLVLQLRRDKRQINNYSMSIRVAAFIYLLLLVNKTDSKKGELPFVISIEQSLMQIEALYLVVTVYSEEVGAWLFNKNSGRTFQFPYNHKIYKWAKEELL